MEEEPEWECEVEDGTWILFDEGRFLDFDDKIVTYFYENMPEEFREIIDYLNEDNKKTRLYRTKRSYYYYPIFHLVYYKPDSSPFIETAMESYDEVRERFPALYKEFYSLFHELVKKIDFEDLYDWYAIMKAYSLCEDDEQKEYEVLEIYNIGVYEELIEGWYKDWECYRRWRR